MYWETKRNEPFESELITFVAADSIEGSETRSSGSSRVGLLEARSLGKITLAKAEVVKKTPKTNKSGENIVKNHVLAC